MVFTIKSIKLYDENTRFQIKNNLRVLNSNQSKSKITYYRVYLTKGNGKNFIGICEFRFFYKIYK
jgi:hypothetical protein